MQLGYTYRWVKDADFQRTNPITGVIVSVTQQEKDIILQFSANEELMQISLWGKNRNTMIQKLGMDTDKWIGQRFRILQSQESGSDKKLKTVEV